MLQPVAGPRFGALLPSLRHRCVFASVAENLNGNLPQAERISGSAFYAKVAYVKTKDFFTSLSNSLTHLRSYAWACDADFGFVCGSSSTEIGRKNYGPETNGQVEKSWTDEVLRGTIKWSKL